MTKYKCPICLNIIDKKSDQICKKYLSDGTMFYKYELLHKDCWIKTRDKAIAGCKLQKVKSTDYDLINELAEKAYLSPVSCYWRNRIGYDVSEISFSKVNKFCMLLTFNKRDELSKIEGIGYDDNVSFRKKLVDLIVAELENKESNVADSIYVDKYVLSENEFKEKYPNVQYEK